MGFFDRIVHDVTHPFGLGNAPQQNRQQPVRTPAPVNSGQQQLQVSRTPAPQQLNQSQSRPQALSVRPVARPVLSIAPVRPVAPLNVTVAQPKPLQVGNQVITPNAQARSGAQGYQPPNLLHEAINKAPSIARSAITNTKIPNTNISIGNAGKALGAVAPHIPTLPNTNAISRGINNMVINPLKTTDTHVAQLAQGHNPYSGNVKQQVGQATQDVINASSFLPIGKGAQLIGKGLPLAEKIVTGAKGGAKIGAGFGAAQGLSTSLQDNANLKDTAKNIAVNTVVGGALGTTLGAATPVVGAGIKQGIKGAKLANDARVPLNQKGAVGKDVSKSGDVAPSNPYVIPKTNPTDVTKMTEKDLRYFADKGHTSITDRYGNTRQLTPTPASTGPTKLDNLNPTGSLHVDYSPKQRATIPLADNITTLDKTAGKAPNTPITIYRGAPKSQKVIAPGDFITTNPDLAKSYAGTGHVIQKEVPHSHVLDDKHSPLGEEYLYRPTDTANDAATTPTKQLPGAAKPTTKLVPQEKKPTPAPSTKLPTAPTPKATQGKPQLLSQGIDGSLGNGTTKSRQFAETIKGSPNTAPEVKSALQDRSTAYTPKTNAKLVAQVRKDITTDYEKAYTRATTDVTDRGLATAGELIKLHSDRGEFTQAIQIADQAVKNGTEAGRAVQAMSLYNRVSPEGIIKYATKQAQQADKKLTPEVAKSLHDMAKEVAGMPDGEAKAIATHKMMELARSQNVSPIATQLIDVWKAGLLTAPPTHLGNLVGNSVEGATNQLLIKPVATAIDKATSVVTGQRSRSLTQKGNLYGIKEGLVRGKQYLKTGYDSRNPVGKYDLNQKTYFGTGKLGKAAGAYTESVFRVLGAADQPFYYRELNNSMYDRAITASKNANIGRNERQSFIQKYLQEPPTEAVQGAVEDAKRSVFGNQTALGKRAGAFKRDSAVGNFVIPFSGVPSSIATRILERSPLGVLKAGNEIVKGVKSGNFDQRAFTGALADAVVGTAGAAVVGKALADSNLMTLGYPNTDQKEVARWKAEGKQPYSVRIGNKWVSLNYVQPFGSILAYGAAYNIARKNGDSKEQAVATAAGEAAKAVSGQSFLQGVSGAIGAVQDPTKGATKYVESAVGGITPNLIRSATKATDPIQRQVNSIADAVKQGVPGLRQTLLPKVDTYGKTVPRQSSALNSLLNPLKPSNDRSTPLNKEVDRLHNTDSTNTKMDVQPTEIGKSLMVEKQKINLTAKQRTDLQRQVGQATDKAWSALIQTPEYKALDDAGKVKALNDSQNQYTALTQRKYLVDNNLHQYAKPADKKLVALANGGKTLTDFTKPSVKGSGSTPKTYQEKQDKYNADLKAGKLSRYDQATQGQSLAKEKITSGYSKDTVSLYGQSKAFIADYIAKDPNGKVTYDHLQQLDKQLTDAGFNKKAKFASGLATTTGKGSGGGRKTGKGSRGGKVAKGSMASYKNFYAKGSKAPKLSSSFKLPGQKPAGTVKGSNVKLVAYKTPKSGYTLKKPKNGVFA